MVRINLPLMSAVVLGASISLAAQGTQTAQSKEVPPPIVLDEAQSGHVKTVPAPEFVPSNIPFAIEGKASGRSIRILSEPEMTREDRDLLADAESSIQERAGVANLEFDGAGWTYQKLVCPALPKH